MPPAVETEADTRPGPPEPPPCRTASSITRIDAATKAAPPSRPTSRARLPRKATGAGYRDLRASIAGRRATPTGVALLRLRLRGGPDRDSAQRAREHEAETGHGRRQRLLQVVRPPHPLDGEEPAADRQGREQAHQDLRLEGAGESGRHARDVRGHAVVGAGLVGILGWDL